MNNHNQKLISIMGNQRWNRSSHSETIAKLKLFYYHNSQQDVSDNIGICILSLLSEISTLPSLVIVSFVKVGR